MNVYWLEQTGADVPAENDWLSANEAGRLNSMRFAKRRADWRLGRWTAKRALSVCLDVPAHFYLLKKIEICAAPSGAPEVFFDNEPAAVTISLSHRCGIAACAVAMSHANLGCDLEMIEPRSDAFVADYFTTEEQALVAHASAADRDRLLALLWSGKESALKALRAGLRLDTRSVIVIPGATSLDRNGWNELRVRHTDGHNTGDHLPGDQGPEDQGPGDQGLVDQGPGDQGPEDQGPEDQVFHGWWQHSDNLVRTVVSTPPPDSPLRLTIQAHFFDSASRYA